MPLEIVMPRLSDSMEEGTVLRWLKSEGDEVAVGEELVEIETDKANMVYESDTAGTVIELVASEGDTLGIGAVIARLGQPGEGGADGQEPRKDPEKFAEGHGGTPTTEPSVATELAPPTADAAPTVQPAESDGKIRATPLARRIAAENGLDLAELQGSGPGGRIVRADVENVADTPETSSHRSDLSSPSTPPVGTSVPPVGHRIPERPETAKGEVSHEDLTKLQQTVARRMAESKSTAPHFYLTVEVDMTRAVAARSSIKAQTPKGEAVPSFNDMIVKACANALHEHPRANGAYRDGRLERYSRVNVGVAVAAQDALVVPTVFDADRKGLREIAATTRELASNVREGTVTPPELSGGTFTVSNLGMFGIDSFSGVINPPQAGLLAVGAISERPVVRDGEITTAQLMSATLACDHRILYGADGVEFLARTRGLLEEPLSLAL